MVSVIFGIITEPPTLSKEKDIRVPFIIIACLGLLEEDVIPIYGFRTIYDFQLRKSIFPSLHWIACHIVKDCSLIINNRIENNPILNLSQILINPSNFLIDQADIFKILSNLLSTYLNAIRSIQSKSSLAKAFWNWLSKCNLLIIKQMIKPFIQIIGLKSICYFIYLLLCNCDVILHPIIIIITKKIYNFNFINKLGCAIKTFFEA